MHVSDFVLNHDGIICTVAMPGRDQLGRFLGEQDDELTNNCLISIFTLVAETICTEDDLSDTMDSDEDDYRFTNVCDGDEPLWPEEVEAWAMQRYPGAFPEVMSLAEVEMYTNHVTESDDADENPLMPSQGGSSRLRESSADILHRPVGYDSTWRSLADLRYMRGRSHHSDKRLWWQKLSVERSQNKNYDVLATNTFSIYTDWWNELISEDLENGHVVIDEWRNDDYYKRLLAVNHINHALKTAWVEDWAEMETSAQKWHNPTYRYSRAKVLADMMDGHLLWDFLYDAGSNPRKQAHYEEYYRHYQDGGRDEPELDPSYDFYTYTNSSSDDYDDYPYYTDSDYCDEWYDEETGRKYHEDKDYQALSAASAWNEIDYMEYEMEYERRLDAEDEATTLLRHGGARGWKAGHVAQLQLAEFA